MNKSIYYDGVRLLSLKDINREQPEIYISDGNRTAGKTTYFNRLLVNKFKKTGSQFALICRYKYELVGVSDRFFNDIKGLFFQNDQMTEKKMENNYTILFLNNAICGYALPLSGFRYIKEHSHLFNSIDRMLFDEFQPEDGRYLPAEVDKLRSIHTSVARGKGELVRYVPLYMVSNSVDLLNPYYLSFGISERLKEDTNLLRGEGWVMEHVYNKAAAEAQASSAFNRAFGSDRYAEYLTSRKYLNNSAAFVENLNGENTLICNFISYGEYYAIRLYQKEQFFYVSENPDKTRLTYALTALDHFKGSVLLNNKMPIYRTVREAFNLGRIRFKNQKCKHALFTFLSI